MKEEVSGTDEIHDREGRYADAFRIGHSAYKFVLDFGQFSSEMGNTNFHTQVILGPDTAKDFRERFGQSIQQYEEQFGHIDHTE